ncbi:tetratricopeptide repeat protein [Acinetobacter sp. V110_1]|uniref:tetratricopeptide repeat protein n=1 Tax=Acinetobacter sp. V110_1 TaxID=3072988 RepID=UPI00287D8D44|nr:tetratricopeptide repeat protein [Acinetobacter sp. V110_1]MDS7945504.1 tetratricopeptide repeat protein [Acinetobacter sp. V110_1]
MKFFLSIFIFSTLTLMGCNSSNVKVKSSNSELSKYQKNAENGDPIAQYNMGVVYQQGLSGEKVNLDKAVYWFKKAAEQGEEEAQANLGVIYYTEGTKYTNIPKAVDIFSELSKKDNRVALNFLGRMYKDGVGVKQDNNKAFNLFNSAALLGDLSAQFNLGNMYFNGDGIPLDYEKAAYWYNKAIIKGKDGDAAKILAGMYYEGRGVEKNINKSIELLQIAADQGDQEAAKNIEIIKRECGC